MTGSSDSSQPSPGSNPSSLLTQVGSSSRLDSVFRGSTGLESIATKDKLNLPTVLEPRSLTSASGVGDSVEIWDVRRGWIAKWSVTGSAAEGGISGKRVIPFFQSYNILKRGDRYRLWRLACDLGSACEWNFLADRFERCYEAARCYTSCSHDMGTGWIISVR